MIVLTVYSRPECHLCEQLLEELAALAGERARVDVVDISEDLELEAELGLRIPVLRAGDEELCCYRLDADRVERFLAATA